MPTLEIEWRRLLQDGQTCARCADTGDELRRMLAPLAHELRPLGWELTLRETPLAATALHESNSILLNGTPIEDLLPGARRGESCCPSCSSLLGSTASCRTVLYQGQCHEALPQQLIREAVMRLIRQPRPPRVLFLCTGNSCRSQMAEAWARQLWPGQLEVASAGIERHGLNPLAMQVLAEAGVATAKLFSKTIDELPSQDFDWAITLCDHAHESCPLFPGRVRVLHHGFDDPPRLAAGAATAEEAIDHYRRVRDEIRAFTEGLPTRLRQQDTATAATKETKARSVAAEPTSPGATP